MKKIVLLLLIEIYSEVCIDQIRTLYNTEHEGRCYGSLDEIDFAPEIIRTFEEIAIQVD